MAESTDNTLSLTVTSSRHLTQEQKVKLQKATKEFESLFVQMMLKSMRSAQGSESENEFGGESFGGDMMKGMFDTELSKHVGRQGALGIAESLYKKLTGESLHAKPVSTSARAAAGALAASPARARHTDPAETASGISEHAAAGQNPQAVKKNSRTSQFPAQQVQQSAVSADNTTTLPGEPQSSGTDAIGLPPVRQAATAARTASAAKAVMISAASGVQADASKAMPSTGSAAQKGRFPAGAALERIRSYTDIIERTAESVGVDANLLKAMIVEESGGKQHARSSKNAKGLMQLIDTTAQSMGVKNVWDPHQNIQGGARYLKQQLEKFGGDVALALASYNAGPGNVERYNGIPPFRETRNYVKRVMNLFTAFQSLESKSDDVIE